MALDCNFADKRQLIGFSWALPGLPPRAWWYRAVQQMLQSRII